MATISVSLAEDGLYIVLCVVGDMTSAIGIKAINEAHALGMELNVHRYLMDLTQSQNVETAAANYDFAYVKMKKVSQIDTKAIVAAVVAPDDHSHDFMETVLRNAGHLLTIFRDRATAVAYLHNPD